MVIPLAEFALQPPAVRLRRLVSNVRRQLEIVKDLPGKAIAVQTRDPLRATAGLVALWAAGGVGVPVDPQWPRSRQEQVRRKADVAARLELDDATEAAHVTPHDEYQGSLYPGGAYILFTSGSSGDPKGVLVGSEALEGRLGDLTSMLAPRPGGSIAVMTTPTFDISLLEMLLPFVSDMKGWYPEARVRDHLPALAKSLEAERPTIIQGTPTLFSVLTSLDWRPPPGTALWCGGEALPAPLATRLTERSDEVWNLYGPTEATIWSTAWRVTEQVRESKVAPIGVPLGRTTVRLDPATSELWLAGPGLATGYVQEKERTSRCFPVLEGRRWYRTGDLCATDDAGVLHFLGRQDNQIKIRGFRVELEEVEGELTRMPEVAQAAVVPEKRDGVVIRLIAVVVARHLTPAEVRRWCRDNLPAYMCPARVIITDELPRLASGKVDRRELAGRHAAFPEG